MVHEAVLCYNIKYDFEKEKYFKVNENLGTLADLIFSIRVRDASVSSQWNLIDNHLNHQDAVYDVEPYVCPLDLVCVPKLLPVDDITHYF